MNNMQAEDFRELIRQQGTRLYRDMPWRGDVRPYYVLVSELMLQQTQVARVIPKFQDFIARFPDIESLAAADLADVLRLWQGLGYNRRAKYLHDTARQIIEGHSGTFPQTDSTLRALPGIGPNTAGAIMVYAYNHPSIFIETNVRTVYIHHFFAENDVVEDRQIHQLLTATLDRHHPREFYWALMDYGSWLKTNGVRNASRSKKYKKQSKLAGSVRQVRGQIIELLTREEEMTEAALRAHVEADERFTPALAGLVADGLISETAGCFHLTK